jgi:site-specific DNA recombinase
MGHNQTWLGLNGMSARTSTTDMVCVIALRFRLKSDSSGEALDNRDDRLLTIAWQKPPTKRRRQILLPNNKSRSEVRPQHFERRAQLISAIARGRQWLDDVVSGRLTSVAESTRKIIS